MKKLIYFTLGNNPEYLKLAKLCIDSLNRFNYDGDLLFITNFKDGILNSIEFKNRVFFIDPGDSNLMFSSANKLKIYKFDRIYDYDKIIFSDLDILFTQDPNVIFDAIQENKIYVSNETELMSDEWWGDRTLNDHEKSEVQKNNVRGINAGFFAFNRSLIEEIINIDYYFNQNIHLANACLEQPFFNAYLYRNSMYNSSLTELISHKGYYMEEFDGAILHFAGGPGDFNRKYDRMENFYKKNLSVRKYKTRNDLFRSFEKNLKIAEIGVFKGEFSEFIKEATSPKELHLIDLFEGSTCSGDKDGNNVVWTDLNYEHERLRGIFASDDSVKIHKGFSFDILEKFRDHYFDVIYIDGDHSYDGVKKDLNISLKKIKPGGYICGHDYSSNKFPDVVKAVDEFCMENDLKITALTEDGCPTFLIQKNKIMNIERFLEIVSPYTMTSVERITELFNSLEYIRENKIPGDFVECGVWKGGNILGIIEYLHFHKMEDRQVWLYDTFSGMTTPSEFDVDLNNNRASDILEHVMCECSLDFVKNVLSNSSFDKSRIKYVIGDINQTLNDSQNIPESISLLRLDTDWYESTKKELEFLYPKLNINGVLIIDDYGHWRGAKQATDEFFKIECQKIDYTGLKIIKRG